MENNFEKGLVEDFVPRRERMKRREKAKRIRKIVFYVFTCIAGVLVITWTVSAVERLMDWRSMQLIPAKYGVLEECKEKKAVVVRRETALTVPKPYSIRYLVADGVRVRKGALLLKAESPEINRTGEETNLKLYSPQAGTVYKKTDGLESVLTFSSLKSLNLNTVYDKVTKGVMESQGGKDDSVIKIVDNLSPAYLLFPSSGINLEEGSRISFRISGSEDVFSGTLEQDSNNILLVKISPVPQDLMADRLCNIEVITKRAAGLVVPASSLVEMSGVFGVYAVSAGNMQWTEVEVKGIFDDQAVITGINPGQEIVVNPDTILRTEKK
ncbi:MAG: HlyD family efflux transporter periplasmic adaptor subunit [Bacillota bacterium]